MIVYNASEPACLGDRPWKASRHDSQGKEI